MARAYGLPKTDSTIGKKMSVQMTVAPPVYRRDGGQGKEPVEQDQITCIRACASTRVW